MQSVDKYMNGDIELQNMAQEKLEDKKPKPKAKQKHGHVCEDCEGCEDDEEEEEEEQKQPLIRHVPNEDGLGGVIYLGGNMDTNGDIILPKVNR